jgi:hypothetical protein
VLIPLLLACSARPDVDLSASALRDARERGADELVHLDGTGVDVIAGRPAELGLIDASPLVPSMETLVAEDTWTTAINAQFVIIKGPHTGQQRGATWRGATQLDPPEPGSEALWTLDVRTTAPWVRLYRGDPEPAAPDRRFAIGGLEALAVDSDAEVSPTLANQILKFGPDERRMGRTYLAWDRSSGVLALAVVEQGATGPRLDELPDALRSAGFHDVVMLDGATSSTLITREGGQTRVEARGRPHASVPLRFGIGVRWED